MIRIPSVALITVEQQLKIICSAILRTFILTEKVIVPTVLKAKICTTPATPNETIFGALATSAWHLVAIIDVLRRCHELFWFLICVAC